MDKQKEPCGLLTQGWALPKAFAASLCPQALSSGPERQRCCSQVQGLFVSRTSLRSLPCTFCGTHTQPRAEGMKPHVHLVLQTLRSFCSCGTCCNPCADASSCLPTPRKLMPLPLSQDPCTCRASLPDSFRSAKMLFSSSCFLAWINWKMQNACLTKLPLNPLTGSFYLAEPGSETRRTRLVSRKYCAIVFSLAARRQTATLYRHVCVKASRAAGLMQPAGSWERRELEMGLGWDIATCNCPTDIIKSALLDIKTVWDCQH